MNLEARTVEAMIRIHCRARHGGAPGLCADCSGLLAYALERIERCPFGIDKPVCNRCTVHCYQPVLREKIKAAMRFSGPRMLWRHPLLAIRHLVRSRRYFSGNRSK